MRSTVLPFDNAYNLPRRDYAPGATVNPGGVALRVVDTTTDGVRVTECPLADLEWYDDGRPGKAMAIRLKSGEPFANR